MNISEQIEYVLRRLDDADEIGYDVEGSGLDWKRNFVCGHVITFDKQDNFYFPVRHGGGANIPDANVPVPEGAECQKSRNSVHALEAALAKKLEERRAAGRPISIVGHNIKFDCHFAANHGIMLGRGVKCTQVTEGLIDEHARGFSLDACATRRPGITPKKAQEMYDHLGLTFGIPATRDSMGRFWELPGNDEIAVDYATGDGWTALELWYDQQKTLSQEKTDFIADIEHRLTWTLFKMERDGIRIDKDELERLIDHIKATEKKAREVLPDDLNPRSPPQMRAWCEGLGQTDWPLTEKGNPSFNEKFLKTFPEGQHLIALRKWTNLANSFAVPMRDVHEFMGRVHCELNQSKSDDFGTISGRLSCSNPNLQQIPKHEKELAAMLRKIYCADDGMWFWEADYSQCEPRLFAHYSKEPALVDGYSRTPAIDMHSIVAEAFQADRGTTAKRMNMGMLTGMFPRTFSAHMGWELSYAKGKWDDWFELFPGIADFQSDAKSAILQRGWVKTILGRRCRLDKRRFAYKATSKIIQGGNADIIKYKLLEMDLAIEEQKLPAKLSMTVHDSIPFQTEKGEAGDKAAEQLLNIMRDVQGKPFNLRVPFSVDSGRGDNWSEATFGDGS